MTVRVLLLGASRYYSRSIQSVRDAGYYTITADRRPDSPGFEFSDESHSCDIIDVDGIERICRESLVDVIVPLNDYGVLTASIVSQRLGLPGIPESAAVAATNKETMRNLWRGAGLPCPQYEVHESYVELLGAVKRIGVPCIVKPAHGVGGGSRGVSVISHEREVPSALRMALDAYSDSSVIVEEFLPGESEHSCEILLQGGNAHVVAIGDKVKSALPYRVDKSVIYPTELSDAEIFEVRELAQSATKALGISRGVAHLEFSMSPDGPILFEIGARCGGGATPEPIVSYMTGRHMVVEHVKTLLGEESLPVSAIDNRGCVYRFLFGEMGQVESILGWPPIIRTGELLDAEILIAPGDFLREVRTGIDRVGFLVVGGFSRQAAVEAADMLESQIEIRVR